jgi:hypothetical protein
MMLSAETTAEVGIPVDDVGVFRALEALTEGVIVAIEQDQTNRELQIRLAFPAPESVMTTYERCRERGLTTIAVHRLFSTSDADAPISDPQ